MKNEVIRTVVDKKGRIIKEELGKLVSVVGGTDFEKKKKKGKSK